MGRTREKFNALENRNMQQRMWDPKDYHNVLENMEGWSRE